MIVAELSIYKSCPDLIPESPFVYRCKPGAFTLADYWVDTFGAPDESVASSVYINGVTLKPTNKLNKTSSLLACQALEGSFYWDNSAQTLYIHTIHSSSPDPDLYEVGQAYGATNQDIVYIDNVTYDPVLISVPSMAQKADMVDYNLLSFISGSIVFNNRNGFFDDIIDSPIYGNDISIYYLPTDLGSTDYVRDDLIPIATLYVEDYGFTLDKLTVVCQDKRKAQNAKILTETTAQGEWVPLIYGQVRACKALIDEAEGTTGAVTYRAAVEMTSFGTVQVYANDEWTTVTPTTTSLATGTFTLSYANGRSGGASDGDPLECRLVEPTGIVNDSVCEVIIDLNERILNIPYNSSFYRTDEISEACADLTTVGVVFEENIELYEATRQLQNGANIGFRHEIDPDGLRTIRTDDWTRVSSMLAPIVTTDGDYLTTETGSIIHAVVPIPTVDVSSIKDNLTLAVYTDSAVFATSVTVAYDKDFNEGKFKRVTNTDYLVESSNKYRQSPSIEFETFLTTATDANACALWRAGRLSEIRGVVEIELHGQDFYTLRIYDMITIDLTCQNGRTYFGKWKAQIIGINPQFDKLTNKISAILTERTV